MRRIAVAMTRLGVLFVACVWAVISQWPPLRAAGTTVVAAAVMAAVPPLFLFAAARHIRTGLDPTHAAHLVAVLRSGAPRVLLDLRRVAGDLRGVAKVPSQLMAGAATGALVLAALPPAFVLAAVAVLV